MGSVPPSNSPNSHIYNYFIYLPLGTPRYFARMSQQPRQSYTGVPALTFTANGTLSPPRDIGAAQIYTPHDAMSKEVPHRRPEYTFQPNHQPQESGWRFNPWEQELKLAMLGVDPGRQRIATSTSRPLPRGLCHSCYKLILNSGRYRWQNWKLFVLPPSSTIYSYRESYKCNVSLCLI